MVSEIWDERWPLKFKGPEIACRIFFLCFCLHTVLQINLSNKNKDSPAAEIRIKGIYTQAGILHCTETYKTTDGLFSPIPIGERLLKQQNLICLSQSVIWSLK
ncbi:hypothetical protein FKM82_027360 [Ascaphus truei]